MSLCSESLLLQTEVSLRKVESSTKWLLVLLWTMIGSIPGARKASEMAVPSPLCISRVLS